MEYQVIKTLEDSHGKVEVIQAPKLAGSSDVRSAESLYFVTQAGMRMKKVRITLSSPESKIRVEPGALYFMHGNLEIKSSTGGGIIRGLMRRATTGESFFVNEIHGQGEIYLEPTFGHFILMELDKDTIIVDKGMFYAGLGKLEISASINKIAAGILGGEGWFQTKITGTGIAVLFSPVPMDELLEHELNNTKLSVDGNFALMREGSVKFSVEKSSKTWLSTSVSGEGLLQTFQGPGKVWLAPTQGVYDKLAIPGGLADLAGPPGARSTNT